MRRQAGRGRGRSRGAGLRGWVLNLDQVFRDEWGRLLALLVRQYRRLDLAEDGLAAAFEELAAAPPPERPAAWLLTVARRRITDQLRREAMLARSMPLLRVDGPAPVELEPDEVGDAQVRLVLLCAHPSLSVEAGTALTLRLVLGVPTEQIASLFLVPRATMAARLTRARQRLAGASFEVPSGAELASRTSRLAAVVYLAFTQGYLPGRTPELADEAVRLGRIAHRLLPHSRQLRALLALLLLQHARRSSRFDDGLPVLLTDQDRSRWDAGLVDEALDLLRPLVSAPPEAYLLQALIAAEHAIAPTAAATDWPRIVGWYDELLALGDSPVVRLNRAVAVAEADGPMAGLRALDGLELPGHRLPGVRAELLARAGRVEEARDAFDAAIALCDNEPERAMLRARRP